MRRAAVLLALVLVSGCDSYRKLRAYFHGDVPDADGRAGLHVDVEPPDAITIQLDGVRVASLSPYEAKDLRPGPHELGVRAMGYYSFALPVTLVDGEVLKVPVQLRERPDERPRAPA